MFVGQQKRITNVYCDRIMLTKTRLSLALFFKKVFEKRSPHNKFLVSGRIAQSPRNTLLYQNSKKAVQLKPKEELFPQSFKQ